MRNAKHKLEILEYIKIYPSCTLQDIIRNVRVGYNYAAALTKQLCEEGFVDFARNPETHIKHFKFIGKSVWRP